jgi:hypothetical protein
MSLLSSAAQMSKTAGAFAFNTGTSAIVGGVTSYSTGGSFVQGAAIGGLMGAGLGVLGAKGAATKFLAGGPGKFGRGSFARKMVKYSRYMESPEHRRMLMNGGAALAGFVFGGNRTHKRGFNAQRGNSIGR